MNDDFYIGWQERAPTALAHHVRRIVGPFTLVLAIVVGLVAANQRRWEDGRFEFGVQRVFVGVLYEQPVPMLQVAANGTNPATAYLLVGPGKSGLPVFARNHHGKSVRLRGSLIEFGANRMIEVIEVNDGEQPPTAPGTEALPDPPAHSRGDVALTGELVDTKCYFGVMRPATGKVHRACAIRCLSGGVPPGLLVRLPNDSAVVVLLTSDKAAAAPIDATHAGRRLRVLGHLTDRAGTLMLSVSAVALAD
jgi:hypothetical protein